LLAVFWRLMKEEYSYESIKDIFNQYLTSNQLRKTPERYAILEKIYSLEGHFTAELLCNLLEDDYRVSLATVYNTLELLLSCKLVIKHQLISKIAQYEKTFGSNAHNHLVCTNCGRVKEFSNKPLRQAIQNKTFAKFEVSHYSLYVYGLCSKCSGKR
jgi:Fur family transcriptional regulator, ferric uptake regulator